MRELPEKIRAFVAIRMKPEVERAIQDLIAELAADSDGVRWTSAGNLHLTLKFLGPSVPMENIRCLRAELEKLAADTVPFELEAVGVGGFPDLKHPHVLWIGLCRDGLNALVARVEAAASRCGFAREPRPFNAHLTIGRLKRPRLCSELRSRLEAAKNRNFGITTIREMTLYRSITASTGPIYEALAKFQFKSPT